MDRLLQRGAELGLSPKEIEDALSMGRPSHELAWVVGSDFGSRAQTL